MTSPSIHREYAAYAFDLPPLASPRLFSLKIERLTIAQSVRRRFVDALLLDGDRVVPVTFLRVLENGEVLLHQQHLGLTPHVYEPLLRSIREWVAKKGDLHLEADVFERNADWNAEIVRASDARRAFPGMSPYQVLFDEAERYANATPYVYGRSVVDLNPGTGYGVKTLAHLAAEVAVDAEHFAAPAAGIFPAVRSAGSERFDVALWLGARADEIGEVLEAARRFAVDGTIVISAQGEVGAHALREAGATVTKMVRPGCDSLGEFDEWLGIFGVAQTVPRERDVARTAAVAASGRKLRVLFGLRPTAKEIFGGDVVQVRETARALRERGHDVEISMEPTLNADGYDIVHLTNITVPPSTLPQVQSVRAFPGPVVFMPIFTDHADETTWGMSVTTAVYINNDGDTDLAQKLERIERRAIGLEVRPPPPARAEMIPQYTPMQIEIVKYVDYVIANAHAEMHRFYRYLNCEIPYAVAPSCADPSVYGSHAREAFARRYGFEDFVLIPGRYEPRKNQALFFEAMRDLDYPVVCIGRNHETHYGEVIRAFRSSQAVYFGHLPEADLAGAFAAARVVVAPGWDEVVSLTSLNAAISEASMVLTRNSYEHEYFRDDAQYCDPGSIGSIRRAIVRAWETHAQRTQRRQALAERVRTEYSWERSAELTEAAYYRVLEFNPRGRARLERFT